MTGRSALTFGRTRLAPSPVERWLWRVTATILLVHVVLALWSGFRAIWQVLALDVVAPTTVHAGGDTVGYDAWSSGRVPVTIVVELVQGPWHDTVAVDVMRQGWIAGWDPRVFHARRMIPLDASRLRRFSAGPAVVRVWGIGRSQFLRTPPPEVRERTVRIAP